jgi:hypothetical protein
MGDVSDRRDVITDSKTGFLYDAKTGEKLQAPWENDISAGKADAGKPGDTKSVFSREDLAHLEAEPDDVDLDAELDEEAASRAAALRKAGFDEDAVARLNGVGESKNAPSLASITKELEQISELRRTDPKKFWGEETQKRQLRLIEQEMALKAGKAATPAPAASESETEAEAAKSDGLAEIETELAKIAAARKADRRAYDKDEALQARERELLQAREEAKEAARATEQVQATVDAILEVVPDAEAFDASFMGAFDTMSAESQDAVRRALATPADTTRPATDEQLAAFAGLGADASALLKSWGGRAGHRLAAAYAKLDEATAELPDEDYKAAQKWLGGLSKAQRVAVVKGLVR